MLTEKLAQDIAEVASQKMTTKQANLGGILSRRIAQGAEELVPSKTKQILKGLGMGAGLGVGAIGLGTGIGKYGPGLGEAAGTAVGEYETGMGDIRDQEELGRNRMTNRVENMNANVDRMEALRGAAQYADNAGANLLQTVGNPTLDIAESMARGSANMTAEEAALRDAVNATIGMNLPQPADITPDQFDDINLDRGGRFMAGVPARADARAEAQRRAALQAAHDYAASVAGQITGPAGDIAHGINRSAERNYIRSLAGGIGQSSEGPSQLARVQEGLGTASGNILDNADYLYNERLPEIAAATGEALTAAPEKAQRALAIAKIKARNFVDNAILKARQEGGAAIDYTAAELEQMYNTVAENIARNEAARRARYDTAVDQPQRDMMNPGSTRVNPLAR